MGEKLIVLRLTLETKWWIRLTPIFVAWCLRVRLLGAPFSIVDSVVQG